MHNEEGEVVREYSFFIWMHILTTILENSFSIYKYITRLWQNIESNIEMKVKITPNSTTHR